MFCEYPARICWAITGAKSVTDKERYTDRGAISQIYIRISNKRVVGYFLYDTIIESEDQEDIYDNLNKL